MTTSNGRGEPANERPHWTATTGHHAHRQQVITFEDATMNHHGYQPEGSIGETIPPVSESTLSSASPLPALPDCPDGQRAAGDARPPVGQPAGDPAQILFAPARAADLLQVKESWLRRRAARRLVPCTFLGKHLRFSRANLEQIAADAARPAAPARQADPAPGASRRRSDRPRGPLQADSHRSSG